MALIPPGTEWMSDREFEREREMGTHKILSIQVVTVLDEDPDASYLEQEGFERRLMEYKRGEFGFIGIRAKAIIVNQNGLTQTLYSGGLWGIENDAESSYLDDTAQEQIEELCRELLALGFTEEEILEATDER